jgi:tetratricopeptide (TPR) repeat protein
LSLTWLGSCYGAKFQLDGEKECAKVYFDTALQLAQSIPSNSLSLSIFHVFHFFLHKLIFHLTSLILLFFAFEVLARGNLARYFHEKKEYDRAEEQYHELIATIEKFTPSEQKEIENKEILQSELYVDLGELLRTKRDLEQADQMLKKGIDLIDKYYPKYSFISCH